MLAVLLSRWRRQVQLQSQAVLGVTLPVTVRSPGCCCTSRSRKARACCWRAGIARRPVHTEVPAQSVQLVTMHCGIYQLALSHSIRGMQASRIR